MQLHASQEPMKGHHSELAFYPIVQTKFTLQEIKLIKAERDAQIVITEPHASSSVEVASYPIAGSTFT
jgi:hypothetical protein